MTFLFATFLCLTILTAYDCRKLNVCVKVKPTNSVHRAESTSHAPDHTRPPASHGEQRRPALPASQCNMTSRQPIVALRALMAAHKPKALGAYIIPTADEHNNEYISQRDARRAWITGFTGSAGTAVVTADRALVWTDGRYYTQFEKEVDLDHWTLMKQSLPDTPSMEKWLSTNLVSGSVVGVDPTTIGRDQWTPLKAALETADVTLVAVDENLVDQVRRDFGDPPPDRAYNEVIHLGLKYTGKTACEKITELRAKMAEKKASALVITALDEIAYTLNLRGSDIRYNPVFYSYLVIRPHAAILFWRDGALPACLPACLPGEGLCDLHCLPYRQVYEYLREMAQEICSNGDCHKAVWLSHEASEAIHVAAAGGPVVEKPLRLISEVSPVALAKFIKNSVELNGFRNCHIRDGTAVVRFFRWLHDSVAAGERITECSAAEKLLKFREEEEDFMGPSFETIAGANEHGAVIHYTPSAEDERHLRAGDLFLLDSGGQYRDGTTDITRTRHLSGDPSSEQKLAFTLVLKGQMQLGSAIFPNGVKGNVLDTLARKALWDAGLDYAHGTGHGVGHYLNVHEGPSGISWRSYPNDPGLEAGAIFSNEPGYYKVGHFGIRHEDLVEVVQVTMDSDHPKASKLRGDYDGRGVLGFHTLTLIPHQQECIDVHLLDDDELQYINNYHKRVLETIGPILEKRGHADDVEWLRRECAPIKRN